MRKYLFIVSLILVLVVSGCSKDTRFKDEYESLNGTTTESSKTYRDVNIPLDNPFVYATASDIVSKINNKETFVVYFGFAKCPWCRSVLENLIKAASDTKLTKIYYVDVYDIRDTLNFDGEVTKEGTKDYHELVNLLSGVLSRYTLTKDGVKKDMGEYRIYAPNVVAIKKGEAISLTTGVSEKQTDAYMELTSEMNKESYDMFKNLIKSLDTCNEKEC